MLRLLIPIFALVSIFSSCAFYNYTNTFDSEDVELVGDSFKFENKDVVISYDFTEGYVDFTIYNKTDKSIFIDWKRSGIVLNDSSFSYHQDNYDLSGVKDISYKGKELRTNSFLVVGESSIDISRSKEQIGYLMPKTELTAKHVKVQVKLFDPGERTTRKKIRDQEIETDSFNYSESPLTLGNTIFYSFDRSLQPIQKVKNDFWIGKASMMQRSDFKRFYPGGKQSNRYVSKESWVSGLAVGLSVGIPLAMLGILAILFSDGIGFGWTIG